MRKDFARYIKNNYEDNLNANEYSLSMTFLIGKAKYEKFNLELKEESMKYGDILWMVMEDSYTNCAYKVLGSYEWIYSVIGNFKKTKNLDSKYMNYEYTIQNNTNSYDKFKIVSQKQVQMETASVIDYIVKVDDDMEVNYPNLVNELKKQSSESSPNHMSIFCSAVLNNHVAEWRNDSMTRKW